MTPQATFMISAVIRDGQLDSLRELLATMNSAPGFANPDNELVPFSQFDRLHVARFTILEAKTAEELREYNMEPYPWRPTLVFLGDCDGDGDSFLAELAVRAAPGLIRIFSHCEDFSADTGHLLQWLKKHSIRPKANYINWVGRTVTQVREEEALHRSLSEYLQKIVDETGRDDCRALRQKLLSHVELELHEKHLTLTPPQLTPLGWWLRNLFHKVSIPLILLLLSPLFLLGTPFFFLRLRILERSDPEIFIRPDRDHIRKMSVQEDIDVSNHFNVFGDIKPGPFRLLTLKFLLMVLDYSARHVYRRGYLTRIRTIHFARWVLMDNDRRIYFASNYDGSHESYMDDFINKVAWGLNLVFSNGVAYPSTRWLIKDGARREQVYKYTLRRHQLPSEVWYKAYPGLTAFDLQRNSRIRRGVEIRQASDEEIREWLSLI